MSDPNETLITREEMVELFGAVMPIEAAVLLFEAPDDQPTSEIRAKLREMAKRQSNPSAFEEKAREIADGILSQLTHELRGTTEKGSFHMAHFVPSVVKFRAAIASALEEAEMRGQNDVWLWLESETVGVQREIVLSQMGRFKRATQKET
jgi:hypothetical protein